MFRAYVALLMLFAGCDAREPVTEPVAAPETPSEAALPVPDTIALRHILLSVSDGQSGGRELEDALQVAETLRGRILGGEDMGLLAREYSDDPSGRRGGWLGAGQRETWVPKFSEAAWKLQVGELSPPVVTEFGVHLIRRDELVEVYLSHIVVQHEGCRMLEAESPAANRTEEQAWERAREAQLRLDEGGPFEDVARSYSDGPMGPRGGSLGLFLRGELGPTLDAAVAELDVGERSEIIQTPFGLHIVLRGEAPEG